MGRAGGVTGEVLWPMIADANMAFLLGMSSTDRSREQFFCMAP